MADQKARLKRQFEAIARRVPALRRIIGSLLNGRLRIIRIPLACALILGGVLAILPIFGVWMLPLGLLRHLSQRTPAEQQTYRAAHLETVGGASRLLLLNAQDIVLGN